MSKSFRYNGDDNSGSRKQKFSERRQKKFKKIKEHEELLPDKVDVPSVDSSNNVNQNTRSYSNG